MKTFLTIVIAAFGAVMTSNAEELIEMAPEQVTEQTNDTIYISNPADIEYSQGMLSSKYNYRKVVEEKSLRRWKKEAYLGNDVEPATLWSANREGLSLEANAMLYDFDGHTIFGAGGGLVYQIKWIGAFVNASMGFDADEARTSEHYGKKHPQLHVDFGLMTPALETSIRFSKNDCPSILSLRGYIAGNFKKVWDFKTDAGTTVTTTETDEEYIITTTKTYGDLDAKPHVFGWEAGLRVQLDFGGSPLYIYGQGGYGRSQNFTYSEKQWHPATKIKFGIGIRLFNGHSYNHDNIRRSGYTEKEVKRHNW
jgi:hypothetical protein